MTNTALSRPQAAWCFHRGCDEPVVVHVEEYDFPERQDLPSPSFCETHGIEAFSYLLILSMYRRISEERVSDEQARALDSEWFTEAPDWATA